MKDFFSSLKPAFISLGLLTALLGIIYPLIIYGMGQLFFHHEATGSLLFYQNGKIIGSKLIGQNFTMPKYFHPRPSSAGSSGYDASNSSGSNLSLTSQKLNDVVNQRINNYKAENKLAPNAIIPSDAVTSSGSGLDPHISIANAILQIPRVAASRNISQQSIRDLLEDQKEGLFLGLFGEPRINVLKINLALDKINYLKEAP